MTGTYHFPTRRTLIIMTSYLAIRLESWWKALRLLRFVSDLHSCAHRLRPEILEKLKEVARLEEAKECIEDACKQVQMT